MELQTLFKRESAADSCQLKNGGVVCVKTQKRAMKQNVGQNEEK
jgi:hypothetical protein